MSIAEYKVADFKLSLAKAFVEILDKKPIELKSSNIAKVTYVCDCYGLVIDFKNGRRYFYMDVPETVFLDLIKSDSHGKYFHKNIKGQYSEIKLLATDYIESNYYAVLDKDETRVLKVLDVSDVRTYNKDYVYVAIDEDEYELWGSLPNAASVDWCNGRLRRVADNEGKNLILKV